MPKEKQRLIIHILTGDQKVSSDPRSDFTGHQVLVACLWDCVLRDWSKAQAEIPKPTQTGVPEATTQQTWVGNKERAVKPLTCECQAVGTELGFRTKTEGYHNIRYCIKGSLWKAKPIPSWNQPPSYEGRWGRERKRGRETENFTYSWTQEAPKYQKEPQDPMACPWPIPQSYSLATS